MGAEKQHEEPSLLLTEEDSQINTRRSLKELASELSNAAMNMRFSEVGLEFC